MVTFTVTLKQTAKTTYILKPEDFKLVSRARFIASNSGQMQYAFDVPVVSCPAFSASLQGDDRVMGWRAQGGLA